MKVFVLTFECDSDNTIKIARTREGIEECAKSFCGNFLKDLNDFEPMMGVKEMMCEFEGNKAKYCFYFEGEKRTYEVAFIAEMETVDDSLIQRKQEELMQKVENCDKCDVCVDCELYDNCKLLNEVRNPNY